MGPCIYLGTETANWCKAVSRPPGQADKLCFRTGVHPAFFNKQTTYIKKDFYDEKPKCVQHTNYGVGACDCPGEDGYNANFYIYPCGYCGDKVNADQSCAWKRDRR